MKHILFLSALALVFLCSGVTKGKYDLSFNPSKGAAYKQHLVTNSTIAQSFNGQDMNVSVTADMTASFVVTDVKADLFTTQMTFDKIKVSMDANTMKMSFGSEASDNDERFAEMGTILKSITGIPVDVQTDKKGAVKSVGGVDKLQASIAKAIEASSNEQIKGMSTSMTMHQYSEEGIKSMLKQMTAPFPEQPIDIGDSWDAITVFDSNGLKLSANMKMKLRGVADNIATIEGSGTLDTQGEQNQTNQGVEMKVSQKGEQITVMQINLKTGLLVGAEISQKLKGEVSVMGNAMAQDIVTKITITTE
ncbi:MAG: DUF6263 family protein [Tannerella sp.]|jgi:hypothetical protein|nr:DUF6263 family protein [Tannerella sp.]